MSASSDPGFGIGESRVAESDGVRLHYVAAGEGPLVVLLHGFPEFWYAWRHVLPRVAAAGFRVVAPDLRGYNLSGKPGDVRAYRGAALAGDVAALVRAVNGGRPAAVLAGHDWGGVVAWQAAAAYPALVERLLVINAPHPARMREVTRRSLSQLRRSWYVGAFQVPWLPERLMRAGGFATLVRAMRGDARPGAFTDADFDRYREAWARPGALTGMVNWYRAAVRHGSGPRAGIVPQETVLLWGDGELHLVQALTEGLERWVPRLTVEHLREASHWVPAEEPGRVARAIVRLARAGLSDSPVGMPES